MSVYVCLHKSDIIDTGTCVRDLRLRVWRQVCVYVWRQATYTHTPVFIHAHTHIHTSMCISTHSWGLCACFFCVDGQTPTPTHARVTYTHAGVECAKPSYIYTKTRRNACAWSGHLHIWQIHLETMELCVHTRTPAHPPIHTREYVHAHACALHIDTHAHIRVHVYRRHNARMQVRHTHVRRQTQVYACARRALLMVHAFCNGQPYSEFSNSWKSCAKLWREPSNHA